MNKWERSSPELIARFDACLPKTPGVERRLMFGCPCAFVNGNMFTGLHEQRLIVRLGDQQRAAVLKQPDAEPFVVMGRTMREYVAFRDGRALARRELSKWIKKGLDYARTLPPKADKPRAAKTTAQSLHRA
jgi:TfoX/Sxy family transcriptional regulator of competence genes